MPHRLAVPAAALLFVGGCSTPLQQGTPDSITVQSKPAAAVVVMGQELGVTPLTVPVKAVFPSHYPPEQELLYGRITLKKEGCKDHVATVSGTVLSRGINVQLDCSANPAPAPDPARTSTQPPSAAAHSPSQRLRQLEDIYGQGLISDEEYRQLRQRILDAL